MLKQLGKMTLASAALASVMATQALAGFGSTSKQEVKTLTGSDNKQYELVICTASEEGSYYRGGKRLASYLGINRKTGNTIARAETTDGSNQNMELIEEGICNAGLVQGDVVAYWKAKFPEFFDGKIALKLKRTENTVLIMREGMDEDDLQSEKAKVFVGLPNSGGAGSWTNISLLEENYGKAKVLHGDIDITTLQALEDGEIDAIVKTYHLNPENDSLAYDVAQNKKIYFADLDDSNLNNKIDLGRGEEQIYRFVDTVVNSKGWDTKAETLETNVHFVLDKKSLTKKQLNKVIRAITNIGSGMFN